jgi:D-psicose/D-tagatose/L-ribulose 3-epimerase
VEAFSRSLLGSDASDMLAIWREPYTDGRALAAEAMHIVRSAEVAAASLDSTAS